MEDEIRKYYKDAKVSEETIRLKTEYYKKTIEAVGDPIVNKTAFIEFTSKMNPSNAVFYCDAVFVVHTVRGNMDPELNKYCLAIKKTIHEAPKKEIDGTIEELKKATEILRIEAYKSGPLSRDMDAFLIALLYEEFPIRNDLWDIKIRNFNTEIDNYITHEMFVLNKYKTAGVYGRKVMSVPEHIYSEIKKIFDADSDRVHLFLTHDKKPYTKQQMVKRIGVIYHSAIGKYLSISTIRKIKINTENKNIDIKELPKLADRYSHSISTELIYYTDQSKSFAQ